MGDTFINVVYAIAAPEKLIANAARLQKTRLHTVQKSPGSLYQQIAAAEGIDALVYEMLINFSQNDRIVERFRYLCSENLRISNSPLKVLPKKCSAAKK